MKSTAFDANHRAPINNYFCPTGGFISLKCMDSSTVKNGLWLSEK